LVGELAMLIGGLSQSVASLADLVDDRSAEIELWRQTAKANETLLVQAYAAADQKPVPRQSDE
jgi:hypothetical protein